MHLLFAALIALPYATPRVPAADSTCATLTLAVDAVDFGGHRYDGPEHIRELLAPRDSTRARLPRLPYLWLLDTSLDGAEHYDTVAMTFAPDPTGSPEDFIPLKKIDWAPGDPPRTVRLCWR